MLFGLSQGSEMGVKDESCIFHTKYCIADSLMQSMTWEEETHERGSGGNMIKTTDW
jgi:hypothetical protein